MICSCAWPPWQTLLNIAWQVEFACQMFLKSFENISCLWQAKNVCQTYVCMVAKLTNIGFDEKNWKCLPNNVCSFGQTDRHGLANIWNFAYQSQCSSVWPLHKQVLDKYFLFVPSKKMPLKLTSKCASQVMLVVVAKRKSMLDKHAKFEMFAKQCLSVWSGPD